MLHRPRPGPDISTPFSDRWRWLIGTDFCDSRNNYGRTTLVLHRLTCFQHVVRFFLYNMPVVFGTIHCKFIPETDHGELTYQKLCVVNRQLIELRRYSHTRPFVCGYDIEISLTFWRRNFFNFSTPCIKMWIIQEPNILELWNKLHIYINLLVQYFF